LGAEDGGAREGGKFPNPIVLYPRFHHQFDNTVELSRADTGQKRFSIDQGGTLNEHAMPGASFTLIGK
jgi:hypothetical protein